MATEDIKVNNGRITVERIGDKENVDVAASDVDSVTFTRSVWEGPGALVLHTKEGDVVIRVENDDADDALEIVRGVVKKETASELGAASASDKAPESNEDNDVNVETQAAAARPKRTATK